MQKLQVAVNEQSKAKINLKGRSIVNIHDLDRAEIELVLREAECYQQLLEGGHKLRTLSGHVLATLFYEPSTRTRLSFESAMHRLGGSVISTPDGRSASSAVKGEIISDTIRTVVSYADVIVQRHPAVGSAKDAARAARGSNGRGAEPPSYNFCRPSLTGFGSLNPAAGVL